ncbi:MAG: hypothetical protein ACI9MR_004272, partial [Myxococcota bacterium]
LHDFGQTDLDQTKSDTVYYPFAGADFPTVQRLYPDASRYIMVALQKGGRLPSLDTYNQRTFRWFLRVYSRGWHDFARRGFFHTDHMKRDTEGEGVLEGITPILLAFSTRLGYAIDSVEPIRIADGGGVEVITTALDAQETWDSVRVTLIAPKTLRKVTLDYVYLDLSNGYLKKNANALAFVEQSAKHRVVTKAASHLMQKPFFSIVRDSLVNHAPSIFQDETGIDYDVLTKAFDVTLYGKFTRANKLWTDGVQRSLATAYKKRKDIKALNFKVGYRKDAGSCVQVAVRKP